MISRVASRLDMADEAEGRRYRVALGLQDHPQTFAKRSHDRRGRHVLGRLPGEHRGRRQLRVEPRHLHGVVFVKRQRLEAMVMASLRTDAIPRLDHLLQRHSVRA